MEYRLVKVDEHREFQWDSGKMTELAIHPAESEYRDGEFLWRLAKETVDADDADMNMLPDYDRTVLILEGDTVLCYEDERVVRLKPLEQDRFAGSSKTKSFGKFTCLDLMVKEGNEGYMDVLELSDTAKAVDNFYIEAKPACTHIIYCEKGYCMVKADDKSVMIREGQLMAMDWDNMEPQYTVMGEGTAVRVQVYEAVEAGAESEYGSDWDAEVKPGERGSFFEDYKACLLIANTQFSLAIHLFKGLRNIWYAPKLSAAISKVKKLYLTVIALVGGTLGIGYVLASNFSEIQMMVGLLVWFIIYCLIVSPLIYMALAPKPVGRYIKKVEDLNPLEKKMMAEELAKKSYVDRTVKKYERTRTKSLK